MLLSLASVIECKGLKLPEYKYCPKFTDDCFQGLGIGSLCLAVVFIAFAIVVLYFIDKKYKWFESFVNRYLTAAFIFVWIFGFMVYDIGMYTGEPWSLLGNVPMAILHAFGIFILDSDVSAVHEPFHNNWWFMTAFSLVHFLAAMVSLAFVLKHFGFNIIAAFKRWFVTTKKDTTYVFWGMNNATYYLAKDINQKKDGNGRIVVVRTNNDQETAIAQNGFERLFNFLSLKSKDLDRLKSLDCITTNTYAHFSNLEDDADATASPVDVLRKELQLKSLCRLINKKTNHALHVFLLSENEEENIQAVAALKNDLTIRSFLHQDASRIVKFYCHARYNSIHRVIEDEQLTDQIEVKVIDSSHISIELLKQEVDLQPVSFVDIEKDATVSSPFRSLVIGFGEVGMDAVRFLYEFGAFVKSGSTNNRVERSEFCCHVIDRNMENLAGPFVGNSPAMKPAISFADGKGTDKSLVTLHHLDCQSTAFYRQLEGWLRDRLNYIVICTGNDETNISLAVRVFKLAIRYRKDMEQFCILVRVRNDDNGHIRRIAEHYNRLWAAEMQSTDKKKRTHQKTVSADEHIHMPVYLFGTDKETYTYDNIISDQLRDRARQYKEKYDASINALKKLSGKDREDTPDWDNEHKELMQLTEEYSGFSPTYSGIIRLRRIQSQNMANCLHLYTKQRLARRALGEKDYSMLAERKLFRRENETTYSWKDNATPVPSVIRVLDVLAQTEHLRWNASHEILGYCDEGNEDHKDEARFQHGCLKDWQALSTVVQSYDYNVVDVSLGIIGI